MDFLKRIFKPARPIAIDEFPDPGSMEAHIVTGIYSDALEKGLFGEQEEERLKTLFRNMRLRHGNTVFSEERIEATIQCIQKACGEFADDLHRTQHAATKHTLAQTPEIWR